MGRGRKPRGAAKSAVEEPQGKLDFDFVPFVPPEPYEPLENEDPQGLEAPYEAKDEDVPF